MRLLRVLTFNLLLLAVLLELAAALVVHVRYGEAYGSFVASRRSASSVFPQGIVDRLRPNEPDAHTVDLYRLNYPRRIHPYFSYTFDPDVMAANNFGFLDVDFPYKPRPGEFVVGIFGGSFAQHLGDQEPRAILAEGILDIVRPRGYRSVRILNFAIGGWRMPSTMFTYFYFFGTFHMSILVDGLNETSGLPFGSTPPTYLAFDFPIPVIWEFLLSRTVGSGGGLDQLRLEVADLRRRQAQLLQQVERGPWRHSALTQLIWRTREAALSAEIQALSEEILEKTSAGTRFGRVQRGEADEIEEFFVTYGSRLRLMAEAAERHGVVFVHFIQPNQYVHGSKRFSREEEVVALQRRESLGRQVNRYYGRLIELSADLRDRGIFSRDDLVWAFRNDEETLYEDSFGHMNTRGRSRVAEEIVSMIRAGQLGIRVPLAP